MTIEFNFSYDAKSYPRTLAGEYAITPGGWSKVQDVLSKGCSCVEAEHTASLRRRTVGKATCVYLQCDGCGSALGSGAFSRNEHPNWESYPWWRADLKEEFSVAKQAYWDNLRKQRAEEFWQRDEARRAAFETRRAEYAEWLQSSPEWKEIRDLVMWRSRQRCEACLSATATVVHHLTYEFGKLPPAWQLKAVCDTCHDRLHDGEDEWCGQSMARNSDWQLDESA